jgi:arginyl-tRNA synthetase
MLLGYSMANILKAAGNEVVKVNIYNDRGIAICKSMLGWLKYGNGQTPESTGTKGDHFVGRFYVTFEKEYKAQMKELMDGGMKEADAEKQAPLMQEATALLLKWEAGDADTLSLWDKMNQWVYSGFEETYKNIGIDFDTAYYESKEWTKGKALIEEGLQNGAYFKKDDGSSWVDLTADGLDQKILLRADGTSVYLTQDLGMIKQRYDDYKMDKMIYVVATEQDYHFKVLKLSLQKLGKAYADSIFHLSYGMVDLPEGRMKTREGNVVDADDLIAEMVTEAEERTKEQGKVDTMDAASLAKLHRQVGLAALKFFILKVNPKKKMIFNPKESIDFQGFTGPFVQYTHARICSVLRKAGTPLPALVSSYQPNDYERELLFELYRFPGIVKHAAANYDPSEVANYAYGMAKSFNKFYDKYSLLNAEEGAEKAFRLQMAAQIALAIRKSLALLGIESPERM